MDKRFGSWYNKGVRDTTYGCIQGFIPANNVVRTINRDLTVKQRRVNMSEVNATVPAVQTGEDVEVVTPVVAVKEVEAAVETPKGEKSLTQEQVNEIVKKRLAEEKEKSEKMKNDAVEAERKAKLSEAEAMKEELAELKKEQLALINQQKRDAFEKRMLASGIKPEISAQLLSSVALDKMESFNLEPFATKIANAAIAPAAEVQTQGQSLSEIAAALFKK